MFNNQIGIADAFKGEIMIVAVGNIKGGVGKTTLAVNLAIGLFLKGREVLLVDGDEQATAMAFTDIRSQSGQPGYTAVALHGRAIRDQIRLLSPKYSDIVIDVGGRDTGSLRAALIVADAVVIPVQPRSFDVWAVDQMAELIKEASSINDIRAMVVLNQCDSQGKDNDAAAEALSSLEGIELCPSKIVRRKAWPNAASAGLSVLEYKEPYDAKAANELKGLLAVLLAPVTAQV